MKTIKDIILTPKSKLSAEFVKLCRNVTAKRPRAVIEHILRHGIISNEELGELYGYDHPPRAIRDVRENGVPLLTHMITNPKTGRRMGAYTFDDIAHIKGGRIGGRKAFSKQFKLVLLAQYGSRDAITGERLEERYLQIDHRIPYEVAGDKNELVPARFMLLDASSQRAKSWSCEHCDNFRKIHDPKICQRCFWAFPDDYDHIGMEQKRRVDIIWSGNEVGSYDAAKTAAERAGQPLRDFIKSLLAEK